MPQTTQVPFISHMTHQMEAFVYLVQDFMPIPTSVPSKQVAVAAADQASQWPTYGRQWPTPHHPQDHNRYTSATWPRHSVTT